MKIEFVHDVICSFCFPMSPRMRKIDEKYNNVEITHRSFALAWDISNFKAMFGSHEAVKPEVLGHWEQANQNDDLSRFNIEGMREQEFLFPTSKLPLIAAKAAGRFGGEHAYWEAFDALQHALFVDNKDIADPIVIEAVIGNTSLDFEQWKQLFEDPQTEQDVQSDLDFVRSKGINSVPALIVEDKYLINGAQPQKVIEKTLEDIAEKENLQLNTGFQMIGGQGEACRMEDGQWKCD
ncbi:DsbA family oxidoreductase [Aliicoccus persicus]|uniref:Predicted dithiol-disulfide isomerase, DsbA family n=1 Tax=Aliicoccus persicus TaxID=930138 RepID=A0A662Z2R4_9STAP|nr:DsbA family protein [Aliicoccus persicus]SEV93640.1 Predicted dithiol-disulfide isomerase, DsbA family [Aliicoccus persicus]